jgi:hypothetical protein
LTAATEIAALGLVEQMISVLYNPDFLDEAIAPGTGRIIRFMKAA